MALDEREIMTQLNIDRLVGTIIDLQLKEALFGPDPERQKKIEALIKKLGFDPSE